MQRNIFIFMGAPGSGKGTLASICRKLFGWEKLSTGDLCRQHMGNGTELGEEIKRIIAAGELVSDEIMAEMVKNWLLEKHGTGKDIIFDGYPRTLGQAETFCELLKTDLQGFQPWLVKLDVPKHVIVERLLSRIICADKTCQSVYSMLPNSPYAPKKDMVCDSCEGPLKHRIDDTKESILNRISVYKKHEQEIIDFFLNSSDSCDCSHFIELNGDQNMEEILNDFKKII